jgi:hypothetical protein
MSEILEQTQEEALPRFAVTDDSTAEWCLKKIKEAKADQEKWRQHYAEQMRKVEEATAKTVGYFEGLLEAYFEQVPHKATKTQESYTLPGGRLIRKQQQPKYTTDDETLVPWLEENFMGQLVKVKKSADWAALKKVLNLTPDGEHMATDEGEIVPGVTVEQRAAVFQVEVEA